MAPGKAPPAFNPSAASRTTGMSRSEILSALSFALDLTEDAVPGHALRTCLLGMRIAAGLGLDASDTACLYYALLLKDVGCSNNAARMCQIIGGDDRFVKTGAKLEDWTRPLSVSKEGLHLLWRSVLPHAGVGRKAARMLQIALTQHQNNREMIALRCDRGADIIRKLGLSPATAMAVRSLDEHWDGHGYPDRLTAGAIPLLARIVAVAQHLDIFATERSQDRAMHVMRERSGRWFDPELVKVVESLHHDGTLWTHCVAARPPLAPAPPTHPSASDATRTCVLQLAPPEDGLLTGIAVDDICNAFGDVVDAKSPFTHRHSIGVTEAADRVATAMGLPESRRQLVHRAALLHDIGKLRVPNSILDKPGKLTNDERLIIEEHPGIGRQILNRVAAFQELAMIAGAHHERLDGTGYPDRLTAKDLSIEARIIGVADVFGALSEDRPYRPSLPRDEVIAIMRRDVPHRLDPDCFDALLACTTPDALPVQTNQALTMPEAASSTKRQTTPSDLAALGLTMTPPKPLTIRRPVELWQTAPNQKDGRIIAGAKQE